MSRAPASASVSVSLQLLLHALRRDGKAIWRTKSSREKQCLAARNKEKNILFML